MPERITELTKNAVIEACQAQLQLRLSLLQEGINTSREAANNDTKSSAGDKYETTRAMMQIEEEKLVGQIAELQKQSALLYQASHTKSSATTGLGSLVQTTSGTYFLAVGLGQIKVNDRTVFAVSLASPVGQILLGKKVGDDVVLQQKPNTVLALL